MNTEVKEKISRLERQIISLRKSNESRWKDLVENSLYEIKAADTRIIIENKESIKKKEDRITELQMTLNDEGFDFIQDLCLWLKDRDSDKNLNKTPNQLIKEYISYEVGI